MERLLTWTVLVPPPEAFLDHFLKGIELRYAKVFTSLPVDIIG